MTSQPGRTPETGTPPAAPGPGAGRRPAGVPSQWQLVLPLTLLIILGLAGLRGVVTKPRWNGPLHQYGVITGVALEAVLIILLVIVFRRRAAAARALTYNAVAAKLREVHILAILTAMIGVVIVVGIALHLHAFDRTVNPKGSALAGRPPTLKLPTPPSQHTTSIHVSPAALLWALIILVLLA